MSSDFIFSTTEAAEFLKVQPPLNFKRVEQRYPVQLTQYYLSLIDPECAENDPIWRQCLPSEAELDDDASSADPLAEEEQMPVPRLIHRFLDRTVLLATGRCAVRCRFCFRKRTWTNGAELADISTNELESICNYLRINPQIREVLVSGGDPLMLSFEKLKAILDALTAIESIDIIRIGSRVPVTMPQRITPELVAMLAEYPGLWLMTHFNHPREVTAESGKSCRAFIQAGVPVLNQTVLLAGVNDQPEILEELFRKLIKIKVKPHYLFHVDPVRGVRHFATGIEKGLEILRAFRPRLSSLAVPTFAIDLPEGGGKVALQPDYLKENGYPSICGNKIIPYPEKLAKKSN
ncbi:MAG: KamA family radical SAM protein [Victivallaceae bacterium]